MKSHADKTQGNRSQLATNEVSQKQSRGESDFQFVDNKLEAVAQRKLQEMVNNSPQVSQLRAFHALSNNSPQAKQAAQLKAIAITYSAQRKQPIQKKVNNTGLPDKLKSGIESLSGISIDDVNVHCNSDKPAQQKAHAYTQGTDIHLVTGKENHLPHGAWHLIQQKQGWVKPTMQMMGKVNINDDAGLETYADAMGAKALQKKDATHIVGINPIHDNTIQCKPDGGERFNPELTKIIDSLKALQEEQDVKADPESLKEIVHCIEKASEILKGDDAQAKEALIESARNGRSPMVKAENAKDANPNLQKKAFASAPVQLVGGLAFGITAAVGIGYGIYRIWQNRRQLVTPAPRIGTMQDIPTTREGFGHTLGLWGLTTRERTNEEIAEEVRNRTTHNHNVLYQQLEEDDKITDIARLIQGIRDNDSLCIGTLCHDLTRFLIQKRINVRPTIDQLKELTGATEIEYDLNGNKSLEDILKDRLPGTSVYLGSADAMSGHTFTVVGENRGRVIVADRQPANPVAALKYASAVEAEARLSRNLNPDQQDAVDREFSGRLVLNQFQPQNQIT